MEKGRGNEGVPPCVPPLRRILTYHPHVPPLRTTLAYHRLTPWLHAADRPNRARTRGSPDQSFWSAFSLSLSFIRFCPQMSFPYKLLHRSSFSYHRPMKSFGIDSKNHLHFLFLFPRITNRNCFYFTKSTFFLECCDHFCRMFSISSFDTVSEVTITSPVSWSVLKSVIPFAFRILSIALEHPEQVIATFHS